MDCLQDKKIVLGVTGSIAAYKACELVRLLVKGGAEVKVVMTEAAGHFIGSATFEALTRNPVLKDAFGTETGTIAHIDIVDWADLIVVAPATANFIAKLRAGICDDLLTSTVAARKTPLLIAPAMNTFMWNNPANLGNVKTVSSWDSVMFSGPEAGIQACGDVGKGRFREPADIVEDIRSCFHAKPLAGKTVVITAGPTFEKIDPVRGLTNLSSGKQGYAIAREFAMVGAKVLLVSGPVNLKTPVGVERFNVTSAHDMLKKVTTLIDQQKPDIFISVAAVADYRSEEVSDKKIKKEKSETQTIHLVKNPDILATVCSMPNKPFCVGFAAETEDLEQNGLSKLKRKGADLIIANPASAIDKESNSVLFITKAGIEKISEKPKAEIAEGIVSKIAEQLQKDSINESSN